MVLRGRSVWGPKLSGAPRQAEARAQRPKSQAFRLTKPKPPLGRYRGLSKGWGCRERLLVLEASTVADREGRWFWGFLFS